MRIPMSRAWKRPQCNPYSLPTTGFSFIETSYVRISMLHDNLDAKAGNHSIQNLKLFWRGNRFQLNPSVTFCSRCWRTPSSDTTRHIAYTLRWSHIPTISNWSMRIPIFRAWKRPQCNPYGLPTTGFSFIETSWVPITMLHDNLDSIAGNHSLQTLISFLKWKTVK